MPRNEFMEHAVYKRLQLANSYMYWNIEARMSYVLVALPEWIGRMALQKKQHLLEVQAGSGRGLVLPASMLPEAPKDFSVEQDGTVLAVMQYNWWRKLPLESKKRFLKEYAVNGTVRNAMSFLKRPPPIYSSSPIATATAMAAIAYRPPCSPSLATRDGRQMGASRNVHPRPSPRNPQSA